MFSSENAIWWTARIQLYSVWSKLTESNSTLHSCTKLSGLLQRSSTKLFRKVPLNSKHFVIKNKVAKHQQKMKYELENFWAYTKLRISSHANRWHHCQLLPWALWESRKQKQRKTIKSIIPINYIRTTIYGFCICSFLSHSPQSSLLLGAAQTGWFFSKRFRRARWETK